MTGSKILIIDDEKDYCMIMKSYFVRRKYEVFLAYTLKEGLKLLKKNALISYYWITIFLMEKAKNT